ncbi:quinone oxidoreductase [Caulobacter sp. S45]|uniref:quinone oxidoreductase family protein n=1 Tax=Caulobacter sp. S45 TaxID=1641861 RepID=UPI00131D6F04|nr:quinone oxidoreductase [Caulobacter sp. S45]
MRAIQIARTGGPEVMELAEVETPSPGPGQALVRHHAIGLNFIDTYQRSGLYPMKLPATLGNEAAGVVEAVGEGVDAVAIGDRVSYASLPGAYAEANLVSAERLVKLPDAISFETAAAITLKGLTAEYLVQRIWPLEKGDTVLVHAAAGGVGSLLTQWLDHLGIRVIGVVGTEAKAEMVRKQGCAEVIVRDQGDLVEQVRRFTQGLGVKVVYDSVGKATLEASLKSLARRGLLVSYGNASGPPAPVAPLQLSQNGSLYLTRPTLNDFLVTPQERRDAADALFGVVMSGAVTVEIGQTWPLADVRSAHEALEAGHTTGASVLTI